MTLFGGIERDVVGPGPIGIDAGAHPEASSDSSRRRWWPIALYASWVAQVGLRLWFAYAQPLPTANPDEIGYLSAARMLARHGTELDLSGNTLYRGGYGLLLSPLFLLTDQPVRLYRLVQVENALIGALLLPLAYVLARRCAASRGTAFLVANAAALLPCAVFFGAFALTDAILPVLVLAWFLCSHSWLTLPVGTRAERVRVAAFGAGAAAMAGLIDAVHSRGAVLVAVHACLVLCAIRLRWGTRPAAVLAAGVLVTTMAAGTWLNAMVEHGLYPDGVRNLGGELRERLSNPHGWGWLLRIAVGQLWYQLVVTGGLVGIGLILLIVVASRRGTPGPVRALAVAVLASVVGIATGTAAALVDEHRVGSDAYGRYLACLTPLLFVLGTVTLLRAGRRVAVVAAAGTAAAMAAGAVVVSIFAGPALTRDTFIRFDFPDLSALTWHWTSFQVWPTTAAALVLLAAVLAAACSPVRTGPMLLTCVIGTLGIATLVGDRDHVLPEPAALTTLSDAPNEPTWAKPGPGVALDGSIPWRVTMLMQYRKGWQHPRFFNAVPPTDAPLVIVAWDGSTPAASTWRAGPSAHYHLARERWVAGTGGWAAWTRLDPPEERPQLRP